MASIKVVLRRNMMKKDGTIPLALRISENYKTNYSWLGQYVLEKDWDSDKGFAKKSHPNYSRLNNFILKKLNEANNVYFATEESLTPKLAKRKLKGANGSRSFFELAYERIKGKYDSGVFSVAKSEISTLNNLEEFLNLKITSTKYQVVKDIRNRRLDRIRKSKNPDYNFIESINHFKNSKKLKFRDIDETFIGKYKNFCTVYLKQKPRTITNQLIFIRTLFNVAIKNGVIDKKYYPFADKKEKITIKSGNKIGLNREEIEKIENLELLDNSIIRHTQKVWLTSFYFAGIRISDVLKLKWTDFKDNRLYYTMNKNEKPVSLKIPIKAEAILNEYKKMKRFNKGYVFPFLSIADKNDAEDIFIKTRNATKLLNTNLKKIAKLCELEKPLTNHIARHSFGNLAGDSIHPLMLQKLYRHSDLKTTLNYQANFIHKDADDALDSVINF
ncbi:tyrosine-type recombinase/integrase [Formosa sediminum]|uniref:Tyrosine-type recombinase/integrase n=1 Tax=Formosa sediminum TaxID=2594004 RepID=A0A516GUT7_9FLAO|nr:tyrosine-type recombinase/integrase [Formosa sediminum]QDO95255.1 tyrosine-type recombinase/integrase [Formosa sediminum]